MFQFPGCAPSCALKAAATPIPFRQRRGGDDGLRRKDGAGTRRGQWYDRRNACLVKRILRADFCCGARAQNDSCDAPKQSERILKATPNALFPVSLDDKRFALETHSDGALGRSSAVVPTQLRGIIVARATPENAK